MKFLEDISQILELIIILGEIVNSPNNLILAIIALLIYAICKLAIKSKTNKN